MNNYTPSINESINAKNTSTAELCNTFIINEYYNRLASSSHTIMMGPRGSGKTTLMRMLEVRSLELWENEVSEQFRNLIDFSGVFIPTDRVWKTQYENTSKRIKSKEDLRVLNSQFIYHILQQLAMTVSFRTCRVTEKKNKYRHVFLEKSDESELVKELSTLWCVEPRINSLKSLISSIVIKKNLVSKYLNNSLIVGSSVLRPNVVYGEIQSILDSSISIINTYLNEDGKKWAFLFDELELAPDEIVQPLINSMRGGHPDIILKLALSPYHKGVDVTNSPDSSMKDQDLSYINLTELSESEGIKFCKELCLNLFIKKSIYESVDSCFEKPKDIDIDAVFDSLVAKDVGFEQYLNNRNLNGLSYMEAKEKQSQFRKIKFISYLRDHSKKENGKLKPRRRAADYYAGFENICKSTEYNPRMLIGIMNMFIPIIKEKGVVSISEQIAGLETYFDSFRSLLSTIAVDSRDVRVNNIYNLVDLIANYFKDEIYGERFNPEPKGMLIIDENTPSDLRDAIGFALNAGAMISVKTPENNGIGSSMDKVLTCRLSYLFSHHYGLLLTKQKKIQLNKIMAVNNISASSIALVNAYGFENSQQLGLDL
ncbi:hypothetical protein MA786_001587 [Vibrio parahaemolyticus]|nr:hypothetical protein [Vibrio parahaemolyticus]EIV8638820.1 hypothetical protein [Vibrio parahaemolyticus]EJG0654574.1 hypothetical protein [Vibrio parahaemolyticus]EJG0771670.1 hypothetical protein [Vibrio parahaemolyticus]EJG0804344.1 hypothetical protein [Vibrio parahaemolyticus]